MTKNTTYSAGAVLAVFTVQRDYNPSGKPNTYKYRETVTNTVTLTADGIGTFTDSEAGEGRVSYSCPASCEEGACECDPETLIRHQDGERYSKVRQVKPAKVRLVVTPGLRIEAVPLAPIPAGRNVSSWERQAGYSQWTYDITATVGNKPVVLTCQDLARLAKFAAPMVDDMADNVEVF